MYTIILLAPSKSFPQNLAGEGPWTTVLACEWIRQILVNRTTHTRVLSRDIWQGRGSMEERVKPIV